MYKKKKVICVHQNPNAYISRVFFFFFLLKNLLIQASVNHGSIVSLFSSASQIVYVGKKSSWIRLIKLLLTVSNKTAKYL